MAGTTTLGIHYPQVGDSFTLTDDLQTMATDIDGLITNNASPAWCRAHHSVDLAIPHNAITALTFDSERADTDTMHSTSTNTGRITFTTAGLYTFGFCGQFDSGLSDYSRQFASIRQNSTTDLVRDDRRVAGQIGAIVSLTSTYLFTAGQWIDVTVLHANAASAARWLISSGNFTPEFWAVRLGSGV